MRLQEIAKIFYTTNSEYEPSIKAKTGDVIVSCGVAKPYQEGENNNGIIVRLNDPGSLSPTILAHTINHHLKGFDTGARGYASTPLEKLRRIEIRVPSQKLSDTLANVDELIELRKKQGELLEELRSSLIYHELIKPTDNI